MSKGNASGCRRRSRRKYKSRLGIEEFADQPGGADAINLRPGWREPRSAAKSFAASLGMADVPSRNAAVAERASGAANENRHNEGSLDMPVASVTQIT